MLVASIARLKDCRNTRIIERGKRYVILFIFVFITETCIIKVVLLTLRYLCCFNLSIYTPRVRVKDISINVYCMIKAYFNLLFQFLRAFQ